VRSHSAAMAQMGQEGVGGAGGRSAALPTPPCNAAQDRARRLWLVGRLIWIIFIVLVVVTVIYVATATLQSG
jgi:hypothetical protein